jgi:succinate-semialdehyde dehydrogenase/glutarate-semialdehyde dehydrogenase
MAIESVNPATGERLRVFEPLSPDAVEQKLARASDAARMWRARPVAERAEVVARAGEILQAEKATYARG